MKKEMMIMPRIRKEKNRTWSKEIKLKIINEVIIDGNSIQDTSKKYDISNGMLGTWIAKFKNYGEDALINKRKPGNPLAKYIHRKNLSDIEKLEYELMKLRIENERLKKGYLVEGVGQNKIFIPSNKKSSK